MNKKQTENRILAYLVLAALILVVICAIAALALGIATLATGDPSPEKTTGKDDTQVLTPPSEVTLPEGTDAGMQYLDRMIFFGESTTAHLASRGGLSNGSMQVWKDSSGTKKLSSKLLSEMIVYPRTGENLTIAEAVALEKPDYMVLSFGLNGITGFVANKDSYVNNYSKLIEAIQAASPNTKIILQSVYPVTSDCDDWNENGKEISEYTRVLNEWLPEIAAAHQNVRHVNTASVLTDPDGCLDKQFDYSGDGIHLTESAYSRILYYLRTHPWQE